MEPNLRLPLDHPLAHLRPIQQGDLPGWLAYLQTDAVRQGISWRPRSAQELCEFVDSTNLHGTRPQVRFAMARNTDDALLGTVGFHSLSPAHRSAEVAYDLHPEAWGRGLATAACRAAVAWAMGQGFTRIQATVLCGNDASVRVLQRSGFALEGRLEKHRWVDGVALDAWLYSRVQP